MSGPVHVLAINCGSSSLKYALFRAGDDEREEELARATIDGVGDAVADHAAAVHAAFDALAARRLPSPDAVAHRIVHGGEKHVAPARVDAALLASLRSLVPLAPLHLPAELAALEAARARWSACPQIACFDTAFHRAMPEVARRFPLPKRFDDEGLRRYGFHGLSYEYVVEALGAAARGRVVIAHLGNGASMAAVRDGVGVDTTMGFTPSGGIVMGTRPGDLDPGALVWLLERGLDARGLAQIVLHESGLRGLSGGTSDMRALLERRATDPDAALAIDGFCMSARKAIGALVAVLGGLDALVFTGGIGEHAAPIRAQIAAGLAHLGIAIDDARNAASATLVSPDASRCAVRVVRTDEERMMARHARRLLASDARA